MKLRINYLSFPRFQIKLIFLVAFIILLMFSCVLFEIYLAIGSLKGMGIQAHLPAEHSYFKFVDLQAKTFYFHIIIAFLLGIILSFVATVILSHRLTGPLNRIKIFFSNICKEGPTEANTQIRFRKGDFIEDLAPLINEAMNALLKSSRTK